MTDARPVAVIDIDGVLADVRHRLQHLQRRPKDWDAFFATMADDPLLPEGFAVATELSRQHRIVYLTGRPDRFRATTEAWLRQHHLPEGTLVHRRNGDRRAASELKSDVVGRLTRTARVAVVVDDDTRVLDALRADGVPVFHADWAGFQPELGDAQDQGVT